MRHDLAVKATKIPRCTISQCTNLPPHPDVLSFVEPRRTMTALHLDWNDQAGLVRSHAWHQAARVHRFDPVLFAMQARVA